MTVREETTTGSVLGSLLGWIVTLALLALALEGIFRLCGMRPVVTINEPDPTFGWTKRKNESTRKVTDEYDIVFTINSLGLRGDADLTRQKPAGTRRALFVGDSFVLGYTVDRKDHFVDLVGEALAASDASPGSPKIQALNGGTEGYSTDQEVVWLQKEGVTFEPDVVVACFYQNDVYWNGQQSFQGNSKPRFAPDGKLEPANGVAPPPRGWFAKHSAIGGLLDRFTPRGTLTPGDAMRWQAGGIAMDRDQVVALANPPAECNVADCWARTEACFKKLNETCAAANAKLLFVAIPTREEIEAGALERFAKASGLTVDQIDPVSPSQRALSIAKKNGLNTLDPHDALSAAAKDGTKLYFAKDWHLNPAGCRVLGQAIYAELSKPGFLAVKPTAAADALFAIAPNGRGFPRWPFVVGVLWLLLSTIYALSYQDETKASAFAKVAAMIGAVVVIVVGFNLLVTALGPQIGRYVGLVVLIGFVGYLGWKMLPKLAIMREVHASFVRHGKWYMLPLIVAMLSIGGLLVVASSSPFIAPFIYTLF